MSMKSLILSIVALTAFRAANLGAQEQLRGKEQLRGAVPSQRPIETGSADLTPQQIYQQDGPAVVLLICSNNSGTGELGTGSVIDQAGHIVTNAHVVIEASSGQPYQQIHVYFKPQRLTGDPNKDAVNPSVATVIKWDSAMDLAVLQLTNPSSSLPVVPFGDSDALEAGEPVVAIGHPEQGGFWTLTTGVVSTVIADLGGVKGKDAFQTDASINRGNSGGPLLSRKGAMIGINTSIARKAADGLAITAVNFSIKSNVVKKWLDDSGANVAYTSPQDQTVAAADAPTPAPDVAQAQPQADAATMDPAVAVAHASKPARAKSKPAQAKKAQILTPVKPFSAEDMIARDIAEMEDMEKEMQQEIDKRRPRLNPASTPANP